MNATRNRMSPEAQKVFDDHVIKDLPTEVQFFNLDYATQPVSIKTFIEDDFFLGRILRGNIFPVVQEDLEELYSGPYFEVLLKGAIGWGKTTMAYIGIAYDIYKVSCLKSPADAFGLIPGTSVSFLNIAVRMQQARKIFFAGLMNIISSSPYFNKKFPYDKKIQSELRFPNAVNAYPVAANEQSMLGAGVFSAAMDEVNFFQVVEKSAQDPEGGTYDQALALYNKISSRIRSRMNQRGTLPGHLWIISSSRYPTEFTEKKALEAITDKTIFVREHTVWETKPRQFFMAETFEVEVGTLRKKSRVLKGGEEHVDRTRIINPPMDFYHDFMRDPDKAVQDLAGIATSTIRPFIAQREMIGKMFDAGDAAGLKHPYSAITVTLQDPTERLIPANLHWVQSVFKERGRPDKMVTSVFSGPYFFHVDLALTGDAAGLCICHVVGSKQVLRGWGPERRFETKPIIRVDLALQIVAPQGGEILLSSVRGILYQLRELGMQFGKGSYDSWNSAESLQTLASEGFTVETYSVDREASAYEEVREAIYDERILCYKHPILETELATLVFNEKKLKVDHTVGGSKDVSDGLAGAVHHAEEGFAGGATSQWQNILTVNPAPPAALADQEDLWDKVRRNVPLSPEEIARL